MFIYSESRIQSTHCWCMPAPFLGGSLTKNQTHMIYLVWGLSERKIWHQSSLVQGLQFESREGSMMHNKHSSCKCWGLKTALAGCGLCQASPWAEASVKQEQNLLKTCGFLLFLLDSTWLFTGFTTLTKKGSYTRPAATGISWKFLNIKTTTLCLHIMTLTWVYCTSLLHTEQTNCCLIWSVQTF
jgi:hypothetical protein